MPPVHLQMEFSFPSVVSETGFCRRMIGCILDGGKILGEDDAPFEFEPTRVFAAGKINRTGGLPEMVPVLLGCFTDGIKFRQRRVGLWCKGAGEFQRVRRLF